MNQLQPWGLLVGRILLAYIFVMSGYGKIVGFAGTAGYMAKYGMPMVEALLVASIVIELAGGLMLVVGWKARWAALAIFLWLIPVTLVFHAFWGVPQDQVMMQTVQFQKNLGIMGGMLYVFFCGPGRFSLDRG
jgi:putative oxidoreductase